MSDASPAAVAALPPTVDPQDPLPDPSWTWRRYFVFGLGLFLLAGIGGVLWMEYETGRATLDLVGRLSGVRDVRALDQSLQVIGQVIDSQFKLGTGLVHALLVLMICYLIAPSAEQATKMLATVWAWRGGVSTSSISRAQAPDGSTAEASNVVSGAGAQPPPPPPPAAEVDAAPTSRPEQ